MFFFSQCLMIISTFPHTYYLYRIFCNRRLRSSIAENIVFILGFLKSSKMQPTVNIDINLDKPVFNDDEKIQGRVTIEAKPQTEIIDSIQAILYGIADAQFTNDNRQFNNKRVIVDETSEIWKNCSLEELLSIDSAGTSTQKVAVGKLTLPFAIHLPPGLPPSFYEPLSMVTVRYSIEIRVLKHGRCAYVQHFPFAIQPPAPIERPLKESDQIHTREFNYPKERSIIIECRMRKCQFTPTERIDARIGVYNRWKASLRYVHLSIVKCIQIEGEDHSGKRDKKLVTVQTTGVGLPIGKKKVCVGESYSFTPQFNIPALCPSLCIPGLVKCDYLLKVDVGTSHTCILGTLTIPITIVSESANANEIQDDLVSLLNMPNSTPSSPNSSEASSTSPPPSAFIIAPPNLTTRQQFIDLLA